MSLGIRVMLLFVGVSPYPMWQNIYDGTLTDKGHGVCLDSADHVLIVGETNQLTDYDMWMITLSKSGDSLQSWFYDDGADEKGFAITTIHDGSIAAAGPVGQGMKTFLYDSVGNLIWEQQGNASEDMEVRAVTVSPDSIIYSLGYYLGGAFDHLVIHGYDYEGEQTMNVALECNPGKATDIVSCLSGYIYVGLDESRSCSLRKFSPSGEHMWRATYGELNTKGFGLEINDAGHLFQAGDIAAGSTVDFLLLKWDTLGRLFWDPGKNYDLGADEYCRDIKLDAISDCYLAGYQVRGSERDPALVKTDSAGNMLWAWVDTLEGDQEIEGVEVDADGYVYLAGSHYNGSNWDMLVMKVRQPLTISGIVEDSAGARMSGVPVVLSGDTTVEAVTDTGGYYFIEVYNGGEYTVSPNLSNWTFEPSSRSYSPLAHREWDQDFENGRRSGTAEESMESPAYWKLISSVGPQVVLEYSNCLRGFNVSIFDPLGCKVDEIHAADPSGSLTWGQGVSPGVYFIRADSNPPPSVQKAVLIR